MNVTRKDEQLIFIIESEQANQTVREFLQQFHLSRKKIHELYMDTFERLINPRKYRWKKFLNKFKPPIRNKRKKINWKAI